MGKRLLFYFALFALLAMILEGLARIAIPWVEHAADDGSWRRLWVAEHSETREIFYDFDVFDPLLGWRSKPELRDRVVFGNKTLNTNSLGLRGRDSYERVKAPGTTRIMVLGDSFTFGDDVSDDETYSHYLAELMPNAEVMNFGMHGYGHDQMLILYREVGRSFRPDVVVLGFVYADIFRNLLHFRDYAKPHFVLDGEELRLANSPVPPPQQTLANEPLRSKLADAIRLASSVIETRTGRLEPRAREVSLRILDSLIDEVRADGALPVFLYLPAGDEVGVEALKRSDINEQEAFLLDHCARRKVRCASARPEFGAAAERGIRFSTQLHWGPAGHRASARALAKLLRNAQSETPKHSQP